MSNPKPPALRRREPPAFDPRRPLFDPRRGEAASERRRDQTIERLPAGGGYRVVRRLKLAGDE